MRIVKTRNHRLIKLQDGADMFTPHHACADYPNPWFRPSKRHARPQVSNQCIALLEYG